MNGGAKWPAAWRSVPLWTMFERLKDTGHPDEEMLSVYRDHGVVAKSSRSDNWNQTAENRNIYQLVHPGWLIVNRMKAFRGSVGISQQRGIVSGHYLCFRPRHDADPRFLNWLLRSSPYIWEYQRLSRGVRPNQTEIDNDGLRVLPIRLPTRGEQRAIAKYLDRETSKLDVLIAEQQQLVNHLIEHRAVTIATVVDREPTGARLKYVVAAIRQGWSPQCEAVPANGITEWGVLKAGCANRGVFRPAESKLLPNTVDPRPDLVVRRGEVLVSRANTRDLVGSAAVVDGDYPKLMLSDKTYALKLKDDAAMPEYVSLVLATPRWRELIELEATGASHSMLNISREDILNLPMPLPPIGEQRRAVAHLQQLTGHVDNLIRKANDLVAVMLERRSALVTAAVTGQLDVATYGRGA